MMLRSFFAAAALTALTATFAHAQETGHMDHSGHDMSAMAGPAAKAFADANAKMHEDMAIEYSGNADVDFIRGMIPHHQGAIDMAKIVLEHGTDPEVRKLAEGIIAAQEAEIAWMKAWLEKNGG